MHISPEEHHAREIYSWMVQLITPRPIAWVSTISNNGVGNIAPYSFFSGVGSKPPSVVFCPANRRDGSPKDTLANIEANGQFVVNIVTHDLADVMNQTSAEVSPDVDEFQLASLDQAPSKRVRPARVAAAKASLECELIQTIHLASGPGGANLVIGRILEVYIADEVLDESSSIITERLETIGRMGGNQYVRTTDRFSMQRPQ